MSIFMENLTQRLMCVIIALVTPLPTLYDLEHWRDAEKWKRLIHPQDACAGKQILRHLFAWKASKIASNEWAEWIAHSPSPFHAVWAFYRIWRKKSAPPLKTNITSLGGEKMIK